MGYRIKVLFIIETLDIGGAEKLLLSTLKYIDRDRFKPVVIFLFKGDTLQKNLEDIGVEVFGPVLKDYDVPSLKNAFDFFRCIRLVKKEIQSIKPDIIHTHLFFANIYGRLAGRAAGVKKIISTYHCTDYTHNIKNSLKFKIRKMLDLLSGKFLTHMIIAGNEAVKIDVETHLKFNNLVLIYNGIDVNEFLVPSNKEEILSLKKELLLEENDVILLNIGRLDHQKGQEYLLKALPLVIKSNTNVKLLIAGVGPLEKELKELANNLNIEKKVRFLGKREDIQKIIKMSDLFVFPSIFEGMAIAPMEVMACKRPIITSDYLGAREVVTNKVEGFIVPTRNEDQLAESITKLINAPSLRKEMGEKAFIKVSSKFNISKNVKEIEEGYISLLN